jgi:hypothetical protein
MSIQYVNQSDLDHFSICQEANGVSKENTVQTTRNFTLQTIAQGVIKLMSQKFLARGGYLFFY